MKQFLEWLASKRPVKHITDPENEKYLERYFLFHIPILDITAYLHHFLGSDPDRGLHSHPWSWARSLILTGGYTELLAVDIYKNTFEIKPVSRKPWTINKLRNDTWHRVLLEPDQDAWTLFIHGRRVSGWGFILYKNIKDYTHIVKKMIPYTLDRGFPDFKWWKKWHSKGR